MNQERIIAKMKKLLAMAEGNANEHEAMVAAKQLHAMLAKHNVSMEDLSGEDNPISDEGFQSRNRPWKRQVAMKIAELYFCKFYFASAGRGNASYMFIGTEANRAFAIYIFKMIIKVVEKEGKKQCKSFCGKSSGPFYNSFLTGAKDRINERCKELINSAKAGTLQDEDGTNLPALLSTYERTELMLNDWADDKLNLKNSPSRTKSTNVNGYHKGQEAGSRVQLSRTLHGNNSPKLLGAG